MIKGLFVTGTGTDVGKTYVSARIVKALKSQYKVGYYKAALSGAVVENDVLIPGDLEVVKQYASLPNESCKVSFVYEEAFAPHLAAKKTNTPVDLNTIKADLTDLENKHDFVVIEGSGGIVCPLRDDKLIMLSDVMLLANYPLIIVTSSGLGSINGAVLTGQYAKQLNLNVLGFIMNNFDSNNLLHQDNRIMIERLSSYKVLGYLNKKADKIEWFEQIIES